MILTLQTMMERALKTSCEWSFVLWLRLILESRSVRHVTDIARCRPRLGDKQRPELLQVYLSVGLR